MRSSLVGQPFDVQMSMLEPGRRKPVQRSAAPTHQRGPASFSLGGLPIQLSADSFRGAAQPQTTAIAEGAFSGPAREVPGRSKQEASFGRKLTAVQAYTGPAATEACNALGAEAMAVGNRVAFRDAQPSAPTVAHEVTHVLEGSGGEVRAKNGDTSKVDTAHEGTAEAVEAAVRSGGRAADVIAERGLGKGGDGVQMLQNSFSLSGVAPISIGANDAGQITMENTERHLWPRTVMTTPPIYIIPPPVYFQLVTQGNIQTLGRLPATDPRWTTELGARIRGDLNLEVAGGIPNVLSLSGGVGMRMVIQGGIQASRDTWRIYGGDFSLRGALIMALNAGPNAAIRLEYRASEAEILRGNLVEITPAGIGGMTMTWGRDIELFAEAIESVVNIGRRIGRAITAPISRVVVRAGQSVEEALRGVAEVARVLDCMGGNLRLGIGNAIAQQSYGALWDEALAVSMLQSGGARPHGPDAARNSSVDSILGTLYSELVTGHSFRRTPPTADEALALISWHQRLQTTMVNRFPDVARALGEIGATSLGGMRLIEFMWAMERWGYLRFSGNPNDVADARHGPIIAQMQDAMSQATADQAAACGG